MLVAGLSFATKKQTIDIENQMLLDGRSDDAKLFLEKGNYNGYYPSKHASKSIDISNDWKLAGFDSKFESPEKIPTDADWISVKKPTSVQMAHFQAGKLPDPYVGLNSKLYEPLEKKIWYYKKKFTPSVAPTKNSILYFEGIDYFVKVWLNGKLLGTHQGVNGGPTFDVGKVLKAGENELVVEVECAHKGDRKNFDYNKPRNIVKPIVFGAGLGAEPFFHIGMWDGVRLEILPDVHIERPFLYTKSLDGNNAKMSLEVEILADTNSVKMHNRIWKNTITYRGTSERDMKLLKDRYELEVSLADESGVAFKKTMPLQLYKNRNWFKIEFDVANPKLWWPVGMGDAHLYDTSVSLLKNGVVQDTIKFKTGIRKIERRATMGPRVLERWDDWQYSVNGKDLFIKGANWMIPDCLGNLDENTYRWLLDMAKNSGIQMLRVWGGGPLEKTSFYDICAEYGIMVWQDFTLWHQDLPLRPYNVWEEQVMLSIFRLRNNPAMTIWCGGNGYNPFSAGNTQYVGIIERTLNMYDNTRPFVRSSSDAGNVHNYPDMDPCWYARVFRYVPFISETGIHSVMSADNVRKVVDKSELNELGQMYDKSFAGKHPQLMNHFVEYNPSRIPRMLSRASHIDDMNNPTLDSIAEATQIGSGEFYQVFSEQMQSNSPLTSGLLVWVFTRSWPSFSAIMLVDGYGQPAAPYYFLKRTYEKTHIAALMPRLIWKAGEKIPFELSITNFGKIEKPTTAQLNVYNNKFEKVSSNKFNVGTFPEGSSLKKISGGEFEIPSSFTDTFFFVEAILYDADGKVISNSVYYPRCLKLAEDERTYKRLNRFPIPYKDYFPWITLKNGPWLKPTIKAAPKAELETKIISEKCDGKNCSAMLEIANNSDVPAFMTQIKVAGAFRYYADDNFFWLAPKSKKQIKVVWQKDNAPCEIKVEAWNSK